VSSLPRTARAVAGVLLFSFLFSLAPAVSPQPAAQSPMTPAIASRERELAAVRAEIARLQARLQEEKQRRSGLQDELAAADLELQLQEAATARDLAARRAAAGEGEVARQEQDVGNARRAMERRLTALYRLGRQGYLRLFLALDPRRPLLPSLRLMRYLARRDRQTFDRYREARERLARERDRLVAEREERQRWIEREAARRQELFASRARKAASSRSARASSPRSSTSSTGGTRRPWRALPSSASAASSTGRRRGR
jgi:septal ring factor EnvC (AmiA/AmiB activator)